MEDNSILDDIKKLLGMPMCYTPFDTDIIIHINSVLSNLSQMGVVSESAPNFQIEDNSAKWSDFIAGDKNILSSVKTYIYLKVKLLFDPPANATLLGAIESQIKELEYRLYTQKGGY